MKLFFLTIIFTLLTNLIFSQELLIHPSLPSDEITGLHFLNENEVLFINSGGSIFKSYDGGFTWNLKKHFQGESLLSIEFIDDKNGFILPQKQPNIAAIGIIITTDAGETWSVQPLSVSGIHDFLALSESVSLKSTLDGKIQRLDNFYNNWNTVYELPKFLISDPEFGDYEYSYGYIDKFIEISENEILATGYNEDAFSFNIIQDSLSFLLKSVDSGITWDTLWMGLKNSIQQITYATNLVGWMSDGADIYKTMDGGRTWEKTNTGISFNYIRDLFSIDENIIYANIDNSSLIKSTDSGDNWVVYNLDLDDSYKINFFNKSNGFLYGSNLLKTVNGSTDWDIIHNPLKDDIYSMSFVNTEVGLASGNGGIYKTINGGKSWELKLINNEETRLFNSSILFLNNSVGWVVSYEKVYKTIDLGESWTEVKLSNKSQLYNGVQFYDNNLGIIYSVAEETHAGSRIYENKYHYITEDGGNNWKPIVIDSSFIANPFDKVKFTDAEHIFAIGRNGLWLSRDTAKTWESIFNTDYFNGSCTFDFYDSLFGVLNISYFESYITVDGGKNWKSFTKPDGNHPTDCKIIGPNIWNEQRVLECGENGKLLRYNFNSDGELLFSRALTTYTREPLNSIEAFWEDDFPYVWIGGGGFTVLYRQYEKIFTDIKTDNSNIATKFSLSQNYPNPFNPSTTIKYSIPSNAKRETANTKLIVFDILGREVATLVNKEQKAGNYEVQFDASNLTSGIYFYRLQSGSFVESRKMILIK